MGCRGMWPGASAYSRRLGWQSGCKMQHKVMPMSATSAPVTPYDGHILDLAYDAIFLLELDGTIVFWNRGAEEMYGWKRAEALGRISHELLRTRFPYALDRIMRELLGRGHWAGELQHTTRNGRDLIVSARWALECD